MAGENFTTQMQAREGMTIRRNFDGDLFIESGGYTKQKVDRDKAIQDASLINQRIEKNEERLVKWTKNLFWGTLGAAIILVSWEMVKTFCIEKH